jgi:hypothetical protein
MADLYFNQTRLSENSNPHPGLLHYPASPNPSGSFVEISFNLQNSATVNMAFYDVTGRKIGSLPDRNLCSGYHSFNWDGGSFCGKRVESGIYFCVVSVGGYSCVKRLTML